MPLSTSVGLLGIHTVGNDERWALLANNAHREMIYMPLKHDFNDIPHILPTTMENNSFYKMPIIEMSPESGLRIAQLGLFATFAYFALAEEEPDFMGALVFSLLGLGTFLSVRYVREILSFVIPSVIVIFSILDGDPGFVVWAFMITIIIAGVCYLPDMATGVKISWMDEDTSRRTLGPMWILFAIATIFMFTVGDVMEQGGDQLTQGEGEDMITVTLDSTQMNMVYAGTTMGVMGIVAFLFTAILGLVIDPIRPWHAGVMASGGGWIGIAMVYTIEEFTFDFGDSLFMLCLSGILTLVPYLAFKTSDA